MTRKNGQRPDFADHFSNIPEYGDGQPNGLSHRLLETMPTMTRTIITPSYLAALLDSYAIGADAPGGAGLIEDRSLDRDFSEVRIDGTYDLTDVASELNTIDETGTSSGRALGMRRILIVVTALWFAYWSAALFFSIKDYRYTLRYNPGELGYVEMARNRVYGSIVASIVWPLIAYVVFLTLRWIWRGFKGSARA